MELFHNPSVDYVQVSAQWVVSLSQECLWNPAVMLLSPQQRLIPYRGDMWTRLWDFLHSHTGLARFCPTTVADKLMVSLVCYQVRQPQRLNHLIIHTPTNQVLFNLHNLTTRERLSCFQCPLTTCYFPLHQCRASLKELDTSQYS